jgi:hypothetical protein
MVRRGGEARTTASFSREAARGSRLDFWRNPCIGIELPRVAVVASKEPSSAPGS